MSVGWAAGKSFLHNLVPLRHRLLLATLALGPEHTPLWVLADPVLLGL